MKDGRTRRVSQERGERRDAFLATYTASILYASGAHAGSEIALERERIRLGRGTGVDVLIDDASVSHEHAALELTATGYRIRDLGSTNGIRLNGAKVTTAALKHGDRVVLGSVEFCYVVEPRKNTPPTHSVREG
jgi:two-component system, NtrC family, response regulator GlrR